MDRRPLPTTTLRPARGVAALWSAWSCLLVAAGAWLVRDAPTSPVAWISLTVFVAVAAYFVLQFAVPSSVEVRLTEDELQARTLWVRRRVPWDQVHLARVRRLFGDPVLELEIRESAGNKDPWQLSSLGVLLPVGADVAALHRFLAARLGTGDLRAPHRLQPLDPA
ncbi:MAG TPA: hypothetical protein VGA36_07680 [Nitriliruptorales bacterium]